LLLTNDGYLTNKIDSMRGILNTNISMFVFIAASIIIGVYGYSLELLTFESH